MTPDWPLLGQVTALGVSGFVMAVTNSLTQIACNATLQTWGGDVYVGIMTVINSVRELFTLPVHGLTQGAQPVLSYNYGAGKYRRVRKGIVFMTVSCFAFTSLVWLVTITKPALFIRLFNSDEQLVTLGAPALAAEGAQAHKLLAAARVAQVKARGAVMIVHYGNSPLYLIYPLIYPCAALPF